MAALLRYAPAAAGQLAFAGAPYTGWEGGALAFTVNRTGGASGTIAVDWSITISEGAPTPANGTISWNNSEAGSKVVNITLGIVSADRVGTITLSNPRSLTGGQAPSITGGSASFTTQNDTTGPSQPTLGTPTNITTTEMIVPLSFGSTDVHSGMLDHALERAQGADSVAFSQIDQGASIFPKIVTGLTPATVYRYRGRGRNRAGVYSIYSPIVEATTVSTGIGGNNMGQIGSAANLNLAAFPVYSIDMSLNDYSVFIREEGVPGRVTQTRHTSGWQKGNGGWVRLTPPTTPQFEGGINIQNLWRVVGGVPTLQIQEFNYRFETIWNGTLASMVGGGPKYCIVHSRRSFAVGEAEDRPALFLRPTNNGASPGPADNPAFNRANTLSICASQETSNGWGPGPYGQTWQTDLWFYPNSQLACYITRFDDTTGTFQGRNKIPCGELVTIEHRIISVTNRPGYPRGLIAYRLYRENGEIYESGIPWNWDENVPFGAFIYEMQQIGCGQWNVAPGPNATAMDVGGYVTLAHNFGGWLGRR